MSTRYVWNRYNRIATYSISEEAFESQRAICINPLSVTKQGTGLVGSVQLSEPFIEMEDPEDKYLVVNERYTVPAGRFFGNEWTDSNAFYPLLYAQTSCVVKGRTMSGSLNIGAVLDTGTAYEVDAVWGAGASLGPVSGTSQSSYPNDGVQGSYWYTYQGQDNIDPSACSIPSTINGGTAIKITVTPGTGKVYGGTVSYQYQVNLAGAGWTTIATTSATSYQYTVPYGTASIQVRVRAQDNIGFTSSTYVTSSSVTVINNQPPTAPGSIDVTGVVAGRQATITLTAATDPDGTIASYIYERSVDGSAWQQIANVNSLTQTDTISADWGTVGLRRGRRRGERPLCDQQYNRGQQWMGDHLRTGGGYGEPAEALYLCHHPVHLRNHHRRPDHGGRDPGRQQHL